MRLHIIHSLDEATAERFDSAICLLGDILEELENLKMSFEDLKAAQDETDAKVAAVKADIETLMAKLSAIPVPGMTPEQEAALADAVTHAKAINDSLAAVDKLNP